jgi:magnesium chelatase subunit D
MQSPTANSAAQFPFVAVTGQQSFKLALILAAINPKLGGVLISGPRGCAKSTLARGMADLLPGGSHTFVTLPLGATEDMLVGTLDLQQVLQDKNVAFHPGLLSKADGGILYVDEVNLLNDHLVDLLLDVAASGVNCVERDGISHSHDANFILVGTMNPDEGELRPQLQDRFGLAVHLDNQYSLEERVEIVRRREAFDADPQGCCAQYLAEQTQLLAALAAARNALPQVRCSDALRIAIAERCHAAGVEGLRGDIVWYRAALAHAAWCGRNEVGEDDLSAVEELVLAHRRKTPPSSSTPPPSNRRPPQQQPRNEQDSSSEPETAQGEWGQMAPQQLKTADALNAGVPVGAISPQPVRSQSLDAASSSASKGASSGSGKLSQKETRRPNWFTSLVSSAGQWPPTTLKMRKARGGQPVLHFVLLDTSASTLKNSLFANAKAAIMEIAEQAYRSREQLTVWGFGNQQVESFLPRRRAPKALRQLLDTIPAGGGTPLREGLQRAGDYLRQIAKQHPEMAMRTYLITDGRSSQQVTDLRLPGECLLIDIESSPVKRGRGQELARELAADYFSLALAH